MYKIYPNIKIQAVHNFKNLVKYVGEKKLRVIRYYTDPSISDLSRFFAKHFWSQLIGIKTSGSYILCLCKYYHSYKNRVGLCRCTRPLVLMWNIYSQRAASSVLREYHRLLSLYRYISKSVEIYRCNDNIQQSVSFIEHCSQSIEHLHLHGQYIARVPKYCRLYWTCTAGLRLILL